MDSTTQAEEPGEDAERMRSHAVDVSAHLKTLAHPVRLMLACVLLEGEYSVGALEDRLSVRQPTLSQQLTVLREASLVDTRRDGKQIYYRLVEDRTAQLILALYAIFCAGDTDQ